MSIYMKPNLANFEVFSKISNRVLANHELKEYLLKKLTIFTESTYIYRRFRNIP